MQFTNLMLVEFCKKALAKKAKYWYGTFWQPATTSLYNSKKSQYPQHYGSSRTAEYKSQIKEGAMVVDCAGLIKGFFWSQNDTRASKYADGFPDTNADGILSSYCEKTGAIKSIPETPGLVVWSKGHIGVYIGGGYAIEARGFAYGVVKTQVSKRSWAKWGKLKSKYLSYVAGDAPVDDDKPTEYQLGDRTLRAGVTGSDVKELQTILISLNFSCGKWGADGDFGSATEAAVVAFQVQYGLPDTGVVDADDFEKLARLTDPENPDTDDDGDDDEGDDDDENPMPQYVSVTQGNTVYVRSLPSATASIQGVAYLGEAFAYTGTSTDGWYQIEFKAGIGWITKKYTSLTDAPADTGAPSNPKPDAAKAVVVDISQHNGLKASGNDWAKLKQSVDLLILRCGVTRTATQPIGIGVDDEFAYAAKKCQQFGIPFGVYYYGKVKTAAEASKEADKAYDTASPYDPLFYAYDVEESMLTDACITAWAAQIRKRGAKKVGMYIAHNHYTSHKATVSAFDFIWIPRYGKNTGKYDPQYAPAYPCDIHQYTSVGKIAGLADDTVDVNRLTGSKSLGWFLGEE